MKLTALFAFIFISGLMVVGVAQQDSLSPDLKAVRSRTLHVRLPVMQAPAMNIGDPTLETLPIRSSGRDVGTIVEVQGACHCQNTNCDALVYSGRRRVQAGVKNMPHFIP